MTTTPNAELLTEHEVADLYVKWDATPGASHADLIRATERALLARLGEQQPVVWQCRVRGKWQDAWGPWQDSSQDEALAMSTECAAEQGNWLYEARALYARPPAAQPVAQGEREAQLMDALRDTLDFVERHSNRWDGMNGKHPAEVVENARALLAARSAAQGAAQVPQWTSVHDAMPKCSDDEDVPVWTWDGTTVAEDSYGPTYEQPAGPAVGGWVCTGFAFLADIDGRVTHWLPRTKPAAPSPAGGRTEKGAR